jgi:hypothetical protein
VEAVATHVRIREPFWMPVLFGVLVWGCLVLCDERVRGQLLLARLGKTRFEGE